MQQTYLVKAYELRLHGYNDLAYIVGRLFWRAGLLITGEDVELSWSPGLLPLLHCLPVTRKTTSNC